jgi:hypothetical protein
MARFVVRRLFSMAIVMIVISILTFVLFEAIPNGNPAFRLAGRNATQAEIHQIEVKYGFNKPIYVQYVKTMENIFTGQAVSYTQGYNVDSQLWQDLPVTLWLAFGSSLLWLVTAVAIGTAGAMRQGKFADRFLNVLAMVGVSMPPYFLGAVLLYYLSYKAGDLPELELRLDRSEPRPVVPAPVPAVDHARDPLCRVLFAGAALQHPRHPQRGLRSHRPREGDLAAPGAAAPRAAQLPDPDHLAVGTGLRLDHRWGRDPRRVPVRPERHR